jgi:hypothetical protein
MTKVFVKKDNFRLSFTFSYCNSRIIKYDKDGNMMKIFGAKNSGKTGEFLVHHWTN